MVKHGDKFAFHFTGSEFKQMQWRLPAAPLALRTQLFTWHKWPNISAFAAIRLTAKENNRNISVFAFDSLKEDSNTTSRISRNHYHE